MNLEKYIAVSGLPGVFVLASTRPNGLLITDIDNDVTKFISTRQYQFTPLATVSIYTEDDAVELSKVFNSMLEKKAELPPVDVNSSSPELREYFFKILPEHDPEKVHISDIKKVIKWFVYLDSRGLITEDSSEEE
ncbi:MAG: hypothetical protein R2771_03835 [Saprospiraceae bacterium]